ncbi:ABC transporter substrate-binding protein [Paenibacillus thiaminolyticus]|uniref:ABC transporter substrate-binding protein n=1 Tax=Paenibacillus thiaminolyticus TaxID=49283 RepID=UPI003D2C8EB4
MKKCIVIMLSLCVFMTACANGGSESKEQTSDDKKTITVSVMDPNRFLETAARKFEETHPNIRIEIKESMGLESGNNTEGDTQDMNKFIQTVTTEALSGNASDIIAMDLLPLDVFVQKNILVNLYDLMAQESSFDKKQYFEKIIEASQTGDGLYAMPISFSTSAMLGKPDLLTEASISIDDKAWTWDDFTNITRKVNEQTSEDYYGMLNFLPAQLLLDYIENNYSELVQQDQRTANFDSDTFRNKMNQVKSMYDNEILGSGGMEEVDKVLFSILQIYDPGTAVTNILQPNTQLFQQPTENGTFRGGSFKTASTFGINSNSKVQQEAWEFIQFLLSEEMQSSPELMGLPLHSGVVDKKLEAVKQQIQSGKLQLPDGADPDLLDERIPQLKRILEEAGLTSHADSKILRIAMEELQAFMSGQKPAEEVSKLIQNRVMTYLNE